MDRKVLAIFLIVLAGACLVTGCAGRKGEATITPTPVTPTTTPAPMPSIAVTVQPTTAPAGATAVPISGNANTGSLSLDPSLADLSGEGLDEGGFPETGLPTPTLD